MNEEIQNKINTVINKYLYDNNDKLGLLMAYIFQLAVTYSNKEERVGIIMKELYKSKLYSFPDSINKELYIKYAEYKIPNNIYIETIYDLVLKCVFHSEVNALIKKTDKYSQLGYNKFNIKAQSKPTKFGIQLEIEPELYYRINNIGMSVNTNINIDTIIPFIKANKEHSPQLNKLYSILTESLKTSGNTDKISIDNQLYVVSITKSYMIEMINKLIWIVIDAIIKCNAVNNSLRELPVIAKLENKNLKRFQQVYFDTEPIDAMYRTSIASMRLQSLSYSYGDTPSSVIGSSSTDEFE